MWRKQEAEEIHCDEKGAGDQEVHHVHGVPAPHSDLNTAKQGKRHDQLYQTEQPKSWDST